MRCIRLTTVIENHSYEPRHLTGGTIEPEPTPTSNDPYVAALKSMPAQLRQKKLLGLLNLEDSQLEPNHMAQLESFLVEWADVFALDHTEPGSTDVTYHHIETGEHSPIRQPMRGTPFALRDKKSIQW